MWPRPPEEAPSSTSRRFSWRTTLETSRWNSNSPERSHSWKNEHSGAHSPRRREPGTPKDKIIAALAARDRIIEKQDQVMDLATKVLGETSQDKAVKMLVDATYQVACCDRVSLFLVEGGALVCHASPAGGAVGWRLPLSKGVAGQVARTGETMNIPEAYEVPHLFDPSHDLQTGYRTTSILCLPIKDRVGTVLGVLQAINKKGIMASEAPPEESGAEEHFVPFDASDERTLSLLIALTSQQWRVCELIHGKEKAMKVADTQLKHIQDICVHTDIDQSVEALAQAVAVTLHCQQVWIFLKEKGAVDELVCRAAWPLKKSVGSRHKQSDMMFGAVMTTGQTVLLNSDENPLHLGCFQGLVSPSEAEALSPSMKNVSSALIAPLTFSDSDDNFGGDDAILGIAVAANKMVTLSDLGEDEDNTAALSPRRRSCGDRGCTLSKASLQAKAICSLMRSTTKDMDLNGLRNDEEDYYELCYFEQIDRCRVAWLLSVGSHMVKTTDLYSREQRTTRKLNALLTLLAESSQAVTERDLQRIVGLISSFSRDIFECERCTFFMVDHFTGMLVGYFVPEGASLVNGEVETVELRIPMQGVVGRAATTGESLNIQDAWNCPWFSNANDIKTNFKTKTILCAPLKTSNGKVIAAIQCINKIRNEYFGAEDENMLNTVSALLSDLLQRMSLESSYKSFMHTNDAIDADVKGLFREYYDVKNDEKSEEFYSRAPTPTGTVTRTMSPQPSFLDAVDRTAQVLDMVSTVRSWNLKGTYDGIAEDFVNCMGHIKMCFLYFGLLQTISSQSLESFVRGIKGRHYDFPAYHNWKHGFVVLRVTFLLLDCMAFRGLIDTEDILGLLLASLGHDVEHPGFSNAFQAATQSVLALRYNDISVLENHSAAVTCSLLTKDESDMLDGLQPEVFRRIRKIIVETIIGTDMCKHQEIIQWLESSSGNLTGLREQRSKMDKESSLKMCVSILHSADLAHPAFPWVMHKQISKLVAVEFLTQFQEEQRLGLPTLAFMGKDPDCTAEIAPIQVGFVQFVVVPLWNSMNFAAGQDHLGFIAENVETNRRSWQKLADGHEVSDEQPFKLPVESEKEYIPRRPSVSLRRSPLPDWNGN